MEMITTEDGSISYYNLDFDETYHTKAGALTEALKKFSEPSDFKNSLKNKKEINILDICFGLGYNSLIAIQEIQKINKNIKINIYALENDVEIIKKIQSLEINIPEFKYFKEIINQFLDKYDSKMIMNSINSIIKSNIKIIFYIGDANKSIEQITEKFDYIFLDPFSPKKCPELWSLKFIKKIADRSKKGSILTTYSCAREVRKNLEEQGFKIEDVKPFGRRAPSTKGIFN